jgi:hypothetical protein
MKFTIECDMPEEMVSHFLGMLTQMQHLGEIEGKGKVALQIDGENKLFPNFNWDKSLPNAAAPKVEQNGHAVYGVN